MRPFRLGRCVGQLLFEEFQARVRTSAKPLQNGRELLFAAMCGKLKGDSGAKGRGFKSHRSDQFQADNPQAY